jgi:prolyl-tRNA synthetase
MGLKAIALRADTGAIGGDLSHEFHVLADSGESAIYYDQKFDEILASDDFDINEMQKIYAMADEMHNQEKCPVPSKQLTQKRGIEVGHIFNFGTKYSKALNAVVTDSNGNKIHPNMGSYGIGVSRLVAAIIEANHDQNGIIWPKNVAPFKVAIINLKAGDETCDKICEEIYQKLSANNIEVLLDDTKNNVGQKLSIMDLIGIRTQIIIGPKLAALGKAEIKDRQSSDKKEVLINEISNCNFL